MIRRLVPLDCAPVGVFSHIALQMPCRDGGLCDQSPCKSTLKKVRKPMRWSLITLILATACGTEANLLGNPLTLPISGVSTVIGNAAYTKRRGQVEVVVKSNFDAIKDDIRAGGGPILTKAMDTAGVPERDRPTRVIQLQSDMGLYSGVPGALVTALMVYGG